MIVVQMDVSSAVAHIQESEGKINQAIGAALYQGAEYVMAESKKEAPVRTGVLRGSGTVYRTEWNGSYWIQYLGYGGAASSYAWLVHENMTAKHAKGTKAKYLSDPFNRLAPDVVAHVQASVEAVLKG